MSDLNQHILDAHARDDRHALIDLYAQAADRAADVDAECFFLTHAYVFALEMGNGAAHVLYERLHKYGRV